MHFRTLLLRLISIFAVQALVQLKFGEPGTPLKNYKCHTINSDACCRTKYKQIYKLMYPSMALKDLPVESFDVRPIVVGIVDGQHIFSLVRAKLRCQDTRIEMPAGDNDRDLLIELDLACDAKRSMRVFIRTMPLLYPRVENGVLVTATRKAFCERAKDREEEALDRALQRRGMKRTLANLQDIQSGPFREQLLAEGLEIMARDPVVPDHEEGIPWPPSIRARVEGTPSTMCNDMDAASQMMVSNVWRDLERLRAGRDMKARSIDDPDIADASQ